MEKAGFGQGCTEMDFKMSLSSVVGTYYDIYFYDTFFTLLLQTVLP